MSSSKPPLRTIPQDLQRLAPRPHDGHKGTFGRVLLIGGSYGMSGAISLSGMAALRSGAGLVHVAIPESILPIVASFDPCYMTIPCPQDAAGRLTTQSAAKLLELSKQASCVVLGPGLGRSDELTSLVKQLYEEVTVPMVVDADALFALSQLDPIPVAAGPRVLTPHSGEFQRLHARITGKSAKPYSREEECAAALDFAQKHHVTIVLKGHNTYVTNGRDETTNPTGNPGMATGGTGDVLSGILGGLVGQMPDLFPAVRLGVFVHGLAGDLAAAELGEVSLVATDLISHLSKAFLWVR